MKHTVFILFFISLFSCQNTYAYDECFDGDCYTHLNSGWSPQAGIGCIKTGFKYDWKYKTRALEPRQTFLYTAIHNSSSSKCDSPSVLNMDMLVFRSTSERFVDFQELIKKAIDWSWIATNNKLKFTKKYIGDCVTDNQVEANMFLIADGTFKGTYIRLEINDRYTKKNYNWMHFYQQDLTRLKKELTAVKRLLPSKIK